MSALSGSLIPTDLTSHNWSTVGVNNSNNSHIKPHFEQSNPCTNESCLYKYAKNSGIDGSNFEKDKKEGKRERNEETKTAQLALKQQKKEEEVNKHSQLSEDAHGIKKSKIIKVQIPRQKYWYLNYQTFVKPPFSKVKIEITEKQTTLGAMKQDIISKIVKYSYHDGDATIDNDLSYANVTKIEFKEKGCIFNGMNDSDVILDKVSIEEIPDAIEWGTQSRNSYNVNLNVKREKFTVPLSTDINDEQDEDVSMTLDAYMEASQSSQSSQSSQASNENNNNDSSKASDTKDESTNAIKTNEESKECKDDSKNDSKDDSESENQIERRKIGSKLKIPFYICGQQEPLSTSNKSAKIWFDIWQKKGYFHEKTKMGLENALFELYKYYLIHDYDGDDEKRNIENWHEIQSTLKTTIDEKMEHANHIEMGKPFDSESERHLMLALILYSSDGIYNKITELQVYIAKTINEKENSEIEESKMDEIEKYSIFTFCLYCALTKLNYFYNDENGKYDKFRTFKMYCGMSNIKFCFDLNDNDNTGKYIDFVTATSFSKDVKQALEFCQGNECFLFEIDNLKGIVCADISWISLVPNEREVLVRSNCGTQYLGSSQCVIGDKKYTIVHLGCPKRKYQKKEV